MSKFMWRFRRGIRLEACEAQLLLFALRDYQIPPLEEEKQKLVKKLERIANFGKVESEMVKKK